jgi:hypothetical protein
LTAAQIAWPNLSPGFYPIRGVIPGTGPQYMDQNGAFTGFPLTASVAQSLRPFPQFNTNCVGFSTSGPSMCPAGTSSWLTLRLGSAQLPRRPLRAPG